MDIINPLGFFEMMKRYYRRRNYKKLQDAARVKRKLKIVYLGNRKNHQDSCKKKNTRKAGFLFLTPLKLVEKFHEAYVDGVMRLDGEKKKKNGQQEAVRKSRTVPVLLSASTNEIVDSKMVMEIYKRMVSLHVVQSAVTIGA